MTVREALRKGSGNLEAVQIETPYLDAVLLLSETLGVAKERIYASLDDALRPAQERDFFDLVERRAGGMPVSYLRRSKEFYGRSFYVDERVLVPRPDTETLVDVALDLVDHHPEIRRVHDLGTGSGCIALTLAAERPSLVVTASDVSANAREVFAINAERLGLAVPIAAGSYLDGLSDPVDLLVSNPPYLTDDEVDTMLRAGWPEPELALRGGPDGTKSLRAIADGAPPLLSASGRLLLEAASNQTGWLAGYLRAAGFREVAIHPDLAGRPRCVSAARPL